MRQVESWIRAFRQSCVRQQAHPRLVERLEAGRRLTLVSALAGVGKIRLVIEVGSRMSGAESKRFRRWSSRGWSMP